MVVQARFELNVGSGWSMRLKSGQDDVCERLLILTRAERGLCGELCFSCVCVHI